MDRNAKKGHTIFWMNTHILCFPCMAISTDDTLHRIRNLDSICNRHRMYFHFGIHHTNATFWFYIPLLTHSLTGFLFRVCMYVCNACKCTNSTTNYWMLTLNAWHIYIFSYSSVLVLCIDYSIVALFVTCNT